MTTIEWGKRYRRWILVHRGESDDCKWIIRCSRESCTHRHSIDFDKQKDATLWKSSYKGQSDDYDWEVHYSRGSADQR